MVNVYSMSIAVIALFSKGSYAKEPNSRLGNIFKLEDDSLIISTPTHLDDLEKKGISLTHDHTKPLFNIHSI